jgi:hypothetical protein
MTEDDDRMGVYYMPQTRTLLVGLPKENLLATVNPSVTCTIPFKLILSTARLRFRDLEELAITTRENFVKITQDMDTHAKEWEEFQAWKREKKRTQTADVIEFKKDT